MNPNRYFSNPFLPSTSESSQNSQRDDASPSKEFLVQKAFELFQKCCSYYEHHVPVNNVDTGESSSARRIDARYIGSLYIGGLGPCAYLAWKVATSPYYSALVDTNTRHETTRQQLLAHALDVCNDSLKYHRWDYPRLTLLEGPVVGALVVKCLILNTLLLLLLENKDYDKNLKEKECEDTLPRPDSTTLSLEIQQCKQGLLQLVSSVQSLDVSQCEVLYGRSGYLLAIYFLTKHGIFHDVVSPSTFGSTNRCRSVPHNNDVSWLSVIDPIIQEIVTNGRHVALDERILLLQKSTNAAAKVQSDPKDSFNTIDDEGRILPLMWKWHESLYLGAAHGVVGILYTLLCFYPHIHDHLILNIPTHSLILSWIRETIDSLDEFCFPSSNLNSSIDPNWNSHVAQENTQTVLSPHHDRLVHWCHGATGHVLLLIKAFEVFREEKYLFKAQEIARMVIFPRGLLRKGVGLCHGIAGNAYALLEIHRATLSWRKSLGHTQDFESVREHDDASKYSTEWFNMAVNFAVFALENLDELAGVPDRPYSLFEGMAGLSSLLIDLCEPERAEFPFFGCAF